MLIWVIFFIYEHSSAGTAPAGVSVETGWRVKVTKSISDPTGFARKPGDFQEASMGYAY